MAITSVYSSSMNSYQHFIILGSGNIKFFDGQISRQTIFRTNSGFHFLILLFTSSIINGIALGGKGETQLTLISQSEYFPAAFRLLPSLIKKSASQITGIIFRARDKLYISC